jgi:predicted GIY-YIG superfamily endonuclease
MGKRDTYRYRLLKDGKIVHSGITNDPARRQREHRSDGIQFDTLETVGPTVTRKTALEWEGRPQRKAVRKTRNR